MKISRAGNVSIIALLGLGLLIAAAVVFYVYQRNLRRYQMGPLAVVGPRIHTAQHREKAIRRPGVKLIPPQWHPSLEPTFKIIGPMGARKIIQKVLPSYPEWAEEQGVSTRVRLAFRVNDEGGVAPNVWVTRMGYPGFDDAAVQALKQWRFEPLDHAVPLPAEPNVVNDVDRGQPAVIDFTFKLVKPPVRI